MRGLNIFSIFVVGLVTQTLPPVPVSLAEISSTAADIRIQYTIGYHSSKPASQGGYRAVHVDVCVNGNDRLVVKTRSGYFAKR
jgi:Ca-activated chloride channel homolog